MLKYYHHQGLNLKHQCKMISHSVYYFLLTLSSSETYLILECKTSIVNTDRYRLDANATDHIQPEISLDAFNPPTGTTFFMKSHIKLNIFDR